MNYNQEITLDLNSNSAPVVIDAKQGDVDSRTLLVHYTSNGEEYKVNINNSIALRLRKPDMHMCFIDATINYDGTVSVTFTQQCLTTAGRAYADLVEFNAAGQMLSTVSFIIQIQAAPDVMGSAAISSDDFSYLKNTIDQWDRTVAEAQAWANGFKGDEPLEESINISQPGSNNNAKYWAEQTQVFLNNLEFDIDPNTGELILTTETID